MKKLNKLFAILVAMAMVLSLTAVSAFAAVTGTEDAPAKAAITKNLKVPEGATVPAAKFKFEFSPAATGSTSAAPTIPAKYATFATTDTATNGVVTKQATDILSDVVWTTAGRYVYDVTEAQTAYKAAAASDEAYTSAEGTTESFKCSKAKYKMTVDVKAKENGSGFYVSAIAVEKVLNDEGAETSGKATPTNPTGEETGSNDFAFTNSYSKVADTTPTDEPGTPENPAAKASFLIDKTVAGTFKDTTKEFTFGLIIDQSKTNMAEQALTYKKIAKDGKVTPVTDITSFTLKDGEQLAVYGAPIGTTYKVTETLPETDAVAQNYKSSVVVNEGGAAATKATVTNPEAAGTGATVENALVKEGANSAAFTNTNTKGEEPGPEGILISNLPYIALALVAIGGLVAYVVVRRRNADEA